MHGLQLKRQGSNVIILEQDPYSDRRSHQAGIGLGASVVEFLAKYDATGLPNAVPARFTAFATRSWPWVLNFVSPRQMSSWGLLYRVLRANFDAQASPAIPVPPAPREGDGHGEYRRGKRVTGLQYDEQAGTVKVRFLDVTSKEEGSIDADMVIGADGVHSTVRELVQVPSEKEYAGYVAWRGTVPGAILSKETVQYFSNRVVASIMKRSYIIVYVCHLSSFQPPFWGLLTRTAISYQTTMVASALANVYLTGYGTTISTTAPPRWLQSSPTYMANPTKTRFPWGSCNLMRGHASSPPSSRKCPLLWPS